MTGSKSFPLVGGVKLKIEMLNMTGHTKREIVVQKLLKSVELFKSYDLLGEPKMVDFLFFNFGKDVKKTMTFWTNFFFNLASQEDIALYSIVLYPL